MSAKVELATFLISFTIGFLAVKTGANLVWAFVIVILMNAFLKNIVRILNEKHRERVNREAFSNLVEKVLIEKK